jgi:uncharacterized membrane protein (UPF0182 family)
VASALPHLLKQGKYFEQWSAAFTWFFAVAYVILFIAGLFFFFFPYPDPFERMEKFEKRLGAFYADIKYKYPLNRLVPVFFVSKRIIFVYACFFVKVEVIPILTTVSLLSLVLLLQSRPYWDKG